MVLFYGNIYLLKSLCEICCMAFKRIVTFKKCYFGGFGWCGKYINFLGIFFQECLKCEKGLCKLTVVVFPNAHYHCFFWKEALLESWRNSLSNGVLQPTASNASKKQFQTKFLKGVSKISESSWEELWNGIPV